MSSSDANEALATALEQLARSKGVELPSIPDSPGRLAYLRFLRARGYTEEELLPVIQRDRVTAEMKGSLLVALMQAMKSDDQNFVKAVVWMAYNTMLGRDNTNIIIYGLASQLAQDFAKARVPTPSFYAGVFPTDSYNAQCALMDDQSLVLVDTGCMEMAEAVVISFLSKAPTEHKADEIARAIDEYVVYGKRADAIGFRTDGVSFGSGLPAAVTNAFEEYMLAHELGHLALGHAQDRRVRYQSPRVGQSFEVIAKSEFQEFQADMWACRSLLECARSRKRSDSDLPLAIGGVSLGLGVGLLVEASATKHGRRLSGDHPPARERLYMMQVAYELFGAHEDAYVARRFEELLAEVVETHYPSTQLPPMLDRDLNRKMLPVLDSLRIDYSGAPYIRDFT